MSAAGKRLVGVVIAAVVVCVAIGLYIGLYLVNVPGSVAAVQTSVGSAALPGDRAGRGAERFP